jgi:DeoR family glycerol-3-phosphate regulon repressor
MNGPAAEDFLKQFQPDVCLLSCSALSPHGRLGCHRSHEITIKRIIMQQAKQAFLVADHSKAGQHALFNFGTLKNIDVIITDKKPGSPLSRLLKQNSVKYAG